MLFTICSLLMKVEEVCTQYSGVDNKGRNIIGLSTFNSEKKRFRIDDILKWYVSSEFTLQEAARFPLAYSMVKINFYQFSFFNIVFIEQL